MARLEWTRTARSDLHQIRRYIAQDSPERATRMVARIREAAGRLRDFPDMGRRVPEYPGSPFREIVVPPYRIMYRHRTDRDAIRVISVIHGSRQLPSIAALDD